MNNFTSLNLKFWINIFENMLILDNKVGEFYT